MSSQKRGRACEACSRIKIKCSLGNTFDASPPCERCVRLKKDCALVQPKRQKDRVAELEAQVAALTRQLEDQTLRTPEHNDQIPILEGNIGTTSSWETASSSHLSSISKKRKLQSQSQLASSEAGNTDLLRSPSATDIEPRSCQSTLEKLDSLISRYLQERCIERYMKEMLPVIPLVPLTGSLELNDLRNDRPVLLQAIIYAAGPGVVPGDVQEELAGSLIDDLVRQVLNEGKKDLNTILSIQLICLWYRTPKHFSHLHMFSLLEVATVFIDQYDVAGPLSLKPIKRSLVLDNKLDTVDAWRALLVCYLLCFAMSAFSRTVSPVTWEQQHDFCILSLDYSPLAPQFDRLTGQCIRAERLCQKILQSLNLLGSSVPAGVDDPETRRKMSDCRNELLNWTLIIPQDLSVPIIKLWQHLAAAYINELVLHTATNKPSFTAPYVAERLSVTDFPSPPVTADHVTALFELIRAVHGILDVFCDLDTASHIALPGLLFASRAAYALFILAKVYISVTAPGNTYGTILDAAAVKLPEYVNKLTRTAAKVQAVDSKAAPARVLNSSYRLRDWLANYVERVSVSDNSYLQAVETWHSNEVIQGLPSDVTSFSISQEEPYDWAAFMQLTDDMPHFDLAVENLEAVP